MTNEIWKDIVGYEGLYQVSNKGKVRSLDRNIERNGNTYSIKGKVLKAGVGVRGYPQVDLSKKGKRATRPIHRLVAETYIPNPKEYPVINHIDGDKLNPLLENLEWCSIAHNTQHAFDMGLQTPLIGEAVPNSKLKERDVKDIRRRFDGGESAKEIAELYNISRDYANEIRRRVTWRHI